MGCSFWIWRLSRGNLSTFPLLIIRVNLCNLWMILKDWIPGQACAARDNTVCSLVWSVLSSGACFWVGRLSLYPVLIRVNLCNLWMILKDWIPARDDTVYILMVLISGVSSPEMADCFLAFVV